MKYIPGYKVDNLEIIKRIENSNSNTIRFECKCNCGNLLVVSITEINKKKQCNDCSQIILKEKRLNDKNNQVKKIIKNSGAFKKISKEKSNSIYAQINRKWNGSDTSARKVYLDEYKDGDLTFEQFKELSQKNCYYCGKEPSNKYNRYGFIGDDYIYNGLDRVDNNQKHNLNNVVPCCKRCNLAKRDLSKIDFINHIKNIHKYINSIDINQINFNLLDDNLNFQQNNCQDLIGYKFNDFTIINHIENDIFECLCMCGGNEKLTIEQIKNKSILSCSNCFVKVIKNSTEDGTLKFVYSRDYLDGNLIFEDFKKLIKLNCFYCNLPPSNSARIKRKRYSNQFIKYSGLDRVDNTKPHDIDNVVPCCENCNKMKLKQTVEEFKEFVNAVVKLHGEK
jgi:hypothetical protein